MDTGLAIHEGPESPDEPPHPIDMDEEDSQESVTLKNALKPLPDTQPSQLEYLENHQQASALHDGGLRLISRPQDTEIDPAASFTYGKPIKVTPGQFSRAIPPKPRNHIPGETFDNNTPSVRGGLNDKNSKAVASCQVQPVLLPIPRKPSPFEGNRSQQMRSDSRGQPLAPGTSSADGALLPQGRDILKAHQGSAKSSKTSLSRQHPHTGSRERKSFPAVTQKSLEYPQHYQQQVSKTSATTTESHEQKHRLSLPNDTSVSSPQVPEHSPRNGPSREASQVNRPMRDLRQVRTVNTPAHRTEYRSSAHNSNISKKRSGNCMSVPGTARPSRMRSPNAYNESPIRRQGPPSAGPSSRNSSSPQDHLLREACDLEDLAGGVVQSLNSLFNTLKQKTKQKDVEMALMERRAQKQQSKLSKYKKQTEGKINVIQQLEQSHAQLQEQLAAANQQLADRSEKALKLEGKCHQYKEYLNLAIAEQQGLYKAANAKCETAMSQIREAENKHKVVSEQERRQVEATRERLTQMVKSTIAEYKFKEQQFTDKIESLNQELQERDANMLRERETTQKLLQQDETIASFQEAVASVQDAIKRIGSQVEQVAVKVTDVASRQVNQDETVARDTQSKLQLIVERLSALDKHAVPSTDIVQELQKANENIFASTLENVLSSQAESQASVQKLSDSIEDYMEEFWTKLEDREDILTELLEQIKAENEDLVINMQLKDEECGALSERLSETEATIQQREEELAALKEEISELEQSQADDMAEVAEAKLLYDKYEKLKGELAEKATLASELQSRLQEGESALTTQGHEHAKSIEQLQILLQQREEEARAAQQAAVEMAREEVMLDMINAKKSIQTLLDQAQGERATLQVELNTARQNILAMQEEDRRISDIVSNLQSELQAARSSAVSLEDEASQKKNEHQRLMEQHSALIADLEAKLADKDKAVSGLSKDAQIYNRQAREVLSILKLWVRENQGVRDFAYAIEKAEQGDIDGIDPKFKPFFLIDIVHRAIFQYCQSQKDAAPSGEESHRDMPSTVSSRLLDRIRRVTIRTPLRVAPSPRPPSVQTEQAQRRKSCPPRSILRIPTDSNSLVVEGDKEKQSKPTQKDDLGRSIFTGKHSGQSAGAKSCHEEAVREPDRPSRGSFGTKVNGRSAAAAKPRQENEEVHKESAEAGSVHNRGIFNRGPYNRLVAGTKSWPDSFNSKSQSQRIKPVVENLSGKSNNTGEAYLAREPQKRKPLLPQESEVSRKRMRPDVKRKKSLSLFSTPHSPAEQQTEREQDISMPSAPRKGGHRSGMVGSEAGSPTRVSLSAQNKASQAPNVVPGSIRTSSSRQAMSSQDSSQDSNTPYYQRRGPTRGNEESQASVIHSQDVRQL